MDFSMDDFSSFQEMKANEKGTKDWPEPSDGDKSKFFSGFYTSEHQAYEFYRDYAHDLGFSVRKEHHSYWPNSRNIKSKDFVCSKAGFKKGINLNVNSKFRKSNTRTGCPAMIRFSVGMDGVWTVQKCIESHNHELARPEDQHLLRSSRKISDEKASVLKSMTAAGIRTVDAFAYLRDEVGGVENIGFSKRDAYNFIQKERMTKIENGDTNTLIELFKERVISDNMFAWDVETDADDRLLNFFWVDGMGRVDYDCFGDVIIFDTSYRLNKYNLCCAPFVGVNNHWQNVLLGVAFLSYETIESFTWLFKTFLRIMGDKHPITIFTDQDQAMARAIEITLPRTRHRLCQWHISKKAPSKICCFNSNTNVRGLFYECLSKCDSEEEFEKSWAEMLIQGELQNHEWLKELYKIRSKWSTAFNKDCFNLGILSTQRSESTNNVCHGISKATSSITECFLGMEKLVTNWRRNEQDEDFRCSQSSIEPLIKTSPILKQAAKFYSRKLYSFFEEEFLQGVGGLRIEHASADLTTFFIKNIEPFIQSHHWIVHFDSVDGTIKCSCGKFEMMGILCSHCMRVIRQLDIVKIPLQYLLPRWSARARKEIYGAKKVTGLVQQTTHEQGTGSGMIFRNHLSRFAYQISTRAQGNEEAEEYMLSAMTELAENVDSILAGKKNNMNFHASTSGGGNKKLKDPVKRRPKGIANARLKSSWEKRKTKKNKTTATPEAKHATPQCSPVNPSTQENFSSIPDCLTDDYLLR